VLNQTSIYEEEKKMFSSKRFVTLATLLTLLSLLFAACQPQVVEVEKTVVVTEEVMVEGTPVVKEVVVTATPEPEMEEEEPEVAGEPGAGDVYRVAVLSDMTTLNFWSAYGPVNSSFWNYAVSTTFNPTPYGISYHRWDYTLGVAADMPSELEQEGDFWVSTVPFRDDVMWSDGAQLTAEDWAWTAEVALKLNLQGNWADYNPDYLDRIEAVDATTAKVYYHTKPGLAVHQYGVLQKPIVSKAFWEPKVAPLLERLETEGEGLDPESDEYVALEQEIIQELETLDPTGEPVAGAWIFSQWEEGAFVENVRNEDYYSYMTVITEYKDGGFQTVQDGEEFTAGDVGGDVEVEYTEGPWFDRVLFSMYSSDAAVLALDAGEVDFILTPNGLSRGQAEQLSANPNIETAQNPANGFRYLAFNFRLPVLQDKVLRQAIACMIDKQFLTQNLLQGAAIPVNTIIPASNAYWYNPDVPLFCDGMDAQQRMEEAVAMLEEAGYTWDEKPYWREDRGGNVEWGTGLKMPNGESVPELRLLAPSAGYDPLRATAGVYIEQWMNQLGIPVEAELTNFNRILETKNDPEGDWDMFILGWGVGVIPDYACYFLQPGSGWNVGLYDSEEFDARCNDFFAETDRETAREIGFELQNILAEDLPYIYLFTTPMWDAWDSSRVTFPFTDVPDGIGSGGYGLQEYVLSVE
jgi:ABC-type transport system substrate-binding protein